MLGLKCKDIDFKRTLRIERGVGKQVVDDVKSSASAGVMAIADEVLKVIAEWKRVTQFGDAEDWVFASPAKLGRQPLSYSFVWYKLEKQRRKLEFLT